MCFDIWIKQEKVSEDKQTRVRHVFIYVVGDLLGEYQKFGGDDK